MATCSSTKRTRRKKSPSAMCRVGLGEEQAKEHFSQASTSKSDSTALRSQLSKTKVGTGRTLASSDISDLPYSVCMPDGEEMYLSRRLKFDSRNPLTDKKATGRPIPIAPESSRVMSDYGSSPGDPKTAVPCSSAPLEGRRPPQGGVPTSQKPPVCQPPPWPWPSEYSNCINAPPNRTVLQISSSPPERPRANSFSSPKVSQSGLCESGSKKVRNLLSTSILTRKTLTTPGNFAGK